MEHFEDHASELPEDYTAKAGHPLADGVEIASKELVVEAIKTVFDPEIPVNVYDMGLILELEISDKGNVSVGMT